MKAAMKAKDQAALRGLRAIKAAIMLAKTEAGSRDGLTEAQEIKMLRKLAKQRKESLEVYQQQNREDLAVVEREELKLIEKYLPQQMSEAEVKKIVADIIAESGASSPADMKTVMPKAMQATAGRADGKTVSGIVKELLSK